MAEIGGLNLASNQGVEAPVAMPDVAPVAPENAPEAPITPVAQSATDKLRGERIRLDQHIQRLQDSLSSRNTNQTFDPALLKLAQGFLAPTKTGSFGESAGAAAGAYADEQAKQKTQEQSDLENQFKIAQLQYGMHKEDVGSDLASKLYDKEGKVDPAVAQELAKVTGKPEYAQLAAQSIQQKASGKLYDKLFITSTVTNPDGTETKVTKIDPERVKEWVKTQPDPVKATTDISEMYTKSIRSGIFADISSGGNPFDSIVKYAVNNPLISEEAQYYQKIFHTLEPKDAASIVEHLTTKLLDTNAHATTLEKLMADKKKLVASNVNGSNDADIKTLSNAIIKESQWEPKTIAPVDLDAAEGVADMIGNHQLAPPSAYSRSSPFNQVVMKILREKYPDYQAIDFNTIKQNDIAFTKGKQGDITRSLNVAINHTDLFRDLIKNLNNRKLPIWNTLANEFQTQVGMSAPTNLDAMKNILGDELTKGILGGVGALADREKFAKSLDGAKSPKQLNDALDVFINALGGQLAGVAKQYHAGTQKNDFADRFLFDRTVQAIPHAMDLIHEASNPHGSAQANQVYYLNKREIIPNKTNDGWVYKDTGEEAK